MNTSGGGGGRSPSIAYIINKLYDNKKDDKILVFR